MFNRLTDKLSPTNFAYLALAAAACAALLIPGAASAVRAHLRRPRRRARLTAEGETHTPLTSCHRRCLRGGARGRADAGSAVRRCAWARHSADTATIA